MPTIAARPRRASLAFEVSVAGDAFTQPPPCCQLPLVLHPCPCLRRRNSFAARLGHRPPREELLTMQRGRMSRLVRWVGQRHPPGVYRTDSVQNEGLRQERDFPGG